MLRRPACGSSRAADETGGCQPLRQSKESSELVRKADADRVDAGVDLVGKADIFPFGAREQAPDKVDVDAKPRRVAIDQVAETACAPGKIERNVEEGANLLLLGPAHMRGIDAVRLPKRAGA